MAMHMGRAAIISASIRQHARMRIRSSYIYITNFNYNLKLAINPGN